MLKKYYLGGFFWAPIPVKRYQNTSGFAGANKSLFQICLTQSSIDLIYSKSHQISRVGLNKVRKKQPNRNKNCPEKYLNRLKLILNRTKLLGFIKSLCRHIIPLNSWTDVCLKFTQFYLCYRNYLLRKIFSTKSNDLEWCVKSTYKSNNKYNKNVKAMSQIAATKKFQKSTRKRCGKPVWP